MNTNHTESSSAGTRLRRMSAVALLAVGLSSSALSAPKVIDNILDRQWCRHASDRFDLLTDLRPERAQELLAEMEQFHSVALEVLTQTNNVVLDPTAPTMRNRLKVLVFARRQDFERLFDSPAYSGFMHSSLHATTLILGPDRGGVHLDENARHEYTHYLLRNTGNYIYPFWYEEGLASFLSTLELGEGIARVGDVSKFQEQPRDEMVNSHGEPVRAYQIYHATHIKKRPKRWKVVDLMQTHNLAKQSDRMISDFYYRTWLLVHLLNLGHQVDYTDRRTQLRDYLRHLGQGMDADQAFALAFGDDAEQLNRELDRYGDRLLLPTMEVQAPDLAPTSTAAPSCLGSHDVAFELGLAATDLSVPMAKALFNRLDRNDARGTLGKAVLARRRGDLDSAIESASASLEGDGTTQAFASVVLAAALIESCGDLSDAKCRQQWTDAKALHEEALVLEPDRVDALFGKGVVALFLGQLEEAEVALAAAQARAPWAPRINLFLGEAYRQLGDAQRARTYLRRAARWEDDATWRKRADAALALIPTAG